MYSREDCQTVEEKLTKVSLHYRNYLCSKVHQVQWVVIKELRGRRGIHGCPIPIPIPILYPRQPQLVSVRNRILG